MINIDYALDENSELKDEYFFHWEDFKEDGINYYYSSYSTQYVLQGDTWVKKTWNGLTSFYGNYIWTDGTNYYYSNYSEQHRLT